MDGYNTIKSIGRGAFAVVFLVERRRDGKLLVVKKFHTPMRELLERERMEIAQVRAARVAVPRKQRQLHWATAAATKAVSCWRGRPLAPRELTARPVKLASLLAVKCDHGPTAQCLS